MKCGYKKNNPTFPRDFSHLLGSEITAQIRRKDRREEANIFWAREKMDFPLGLFRITKVIQVAWLLSEKWTSPTEGHYKDVKKGRSWGDTVHHAFAPVQPKSLLGSNCFVTVQRLICSGWLDLIHPYAHYYMSNLIGFQIQYHFTRRSIFPVLEKCYCGHWQ